MTKTIRQRVLDAIESEKINGSQLAAMAGVKYSVIVNLKRRENSTTSAENAEKLLRALEKLESGSDGYEQVAGDDDNCLVPVFDVQVSAGYGSLVDYEEQTHSLAFPPDYLRKLTGGSVKSLVIISVKGDSMEPTLLDDDIVLVDMSKTHIGYEGMFVLRHNDTLLVKRSGMAARSGFVTLISDNKSYPPIEASLTELKVVGKVLWYGRKV